jgi:hypothetical protein
MKGRRTSQGTLVYVPVSGFTKKGPAWKTVPEKQSGLVGKRVRHSCSELLQLRSYRSVL